MALFTPAQRRLAAAVGRLGFANPFLPDRSEIERDILGEQFATEPIPWRPVRPHGDGGINHRHISRMVADLVATTRERLANGAAFDERDVELYVDAAAYYLFEEFRVDFQEIIEAGHAGRASTHVAFWKKFDAAAENCFAPDGRSLPIRCDLAHLFACHFQIRRALFHAFHFIVGCAPAAVRLRAAIWQSIFTHDMRRYQRSLYDRLGNVATLITGASGAGKELVARAVGLSRYVPFDAEKSRFVANFAEGFAEVTLAALAPMQIESELFGHRRGAFPGAVVDRVGRLEACPAHGSVFLNEIAELGSASQRKLLRVLQSRTFERLGDADSRVFAGKVVAATNRDLASEMRNGRLREDLYYQLGADRIETPTLRAQLDECPEDLELLLLASARRVAPEEAEALAGETAPWITEHLGAHYPWPGNLRELEQCLRSVLIHGEYRPAVPGGDAAVGWPATVEAMARGELTAQELVRRYCRIVYDQCRSYEETARRLGLDRRTIKAKLQ